MKREGSTTVVYAALAGNLAIAVTKFGAALYTGSSAMFTESLHSLVDTLDQGLLLYGMHRAKRPPDAAHPFGYGLELYFWSFVVALLIFSLGGAFAIYEGVEKILHPEPIRNAWVNFTVLGFAALFEGYSFSVAWREMRRRHSDTGMWSALRRSKDPSTFTVILEDGAALTGLALAAIGVAVSARFGETRADGVASLFIGLLLVGVAIVLARETRSLLTGESASASLLTQARTLVSADDRIARIEDVRSLQIGTDGVLLAMVLAFRDDADAADRDGAFAEAYARVREHLPVVTYLYLVPAQGDS
ncbi:cation diffusion facilitator family transporter [Methylobacterium sp. DB1607]|nr:cation diffusion facilitator family transporter [Methylobacterium sp. DB1607]